MKFIADVMLGKLAKRMRLLGFDVLYDRAYDDNDLIRISREEGRVILTRDTALAARPLAENHLFITGNLAREQLDQVFEAFTFSPLPLALSRCSACNDPLVPLQKEEARDLVPHHVYETRDAFLRCPGCGRIYWRGTHVRRMALRDNPVAGKPPKSSIL